MGKSIEPAISPLGYDWKIGIAIISSLLRESLRGYATIYSVGSTGNEDTIKNKMAAEVNPITEEGVQLRIRDLIIVVLCFCLAMCQYDR
jgi:ferrous iron transport protein B